MSVPRFNQFIVTMLLVLLLTCAGCRSGAREDGGAIPSLQLIELTDNAPGCLLRWDDVHLESRGDIIVVRDANTGMERHRIVAGRPWDRSPVTSMVRDQRGVVVLRHGVDISVLGRGVDGTVHLSMRHSAQDLGVTPEGLRVIDGVCYANGRGGVVCLDDGRRVFECSASAGPVVSVHGVLYSTIGRRIYRSDDHVFVGSASALDAIPASDDLLFRRTGREGVTIGRMNAQCRETDALHGTHTVDDASLTVRKAGGSLWVMYGDRLLRVARSASGPLFDQHVTARGPRDVTAGDGNTLHVATADGVCVLQSDGSLEPVTSPLPGRFDKAWSDGLSMLCWCDKTLWRIRAGEQPRVERRAFDSSSVTEMQLDAATVRGAVRIEHGSLQWLGLGDQWHDFESGDCDGALGVHPVRGFMIAATDDGVLLLDPKDGSVVESLRFAAPVIAIASRIGGGVFVALSDGRVALLDVKP